MARRVRDERRPIVLDLYSNQGKSAIIIERETGISKTAIYNILKEAGISPAALRDSGERRGRQGGYRRFTPEIERQIVADYQSGLGYHPLAETYETSVPTIRRILRRNGQLPRRRGNMGKRIDPVLAGHLVADWNRGMSQHALGIKYDMHQTTVSNVLRRLHIEPERRQLFGKEHPSWKTGRVMQGSGYVYLKMPTTHPWYLTMANMGGYVAEHRLVIAEFLGRPLEDHETVHHVNGQKSDNRIENLQLRQGRHGKGALYQCADCGSWNVINRMLADEEHQLHADGPPVAQEDRQGEAHPLQESQPAASVPQLTLAF